jgi:hypothetical protein
MSKYKSSDSVYFKVGDNYIKGIIKEHTGYLIRCVTMSDITRDFMSDGYVIETKTFPPGVNIPLYVSEKHNIGDSFICSNLKSINPDFDDRFIDLQYDKIFTSIFNDLTKSNKSLKKEFVWHESHIHCKIDMITETYTIIGSWDGPNAPTDFDLKNGEGELYTSIWEHCIKPRDFIDDIIDYFKTVY